MTDYQSIQMLAFNFASRTFAYRRLAQGLSRSLSAFSSFMREYLDRAIKADQCAQFVDDIGIAANDTKQLCINIKTVFECIRNAGLKLSMSKCNFGVKQVDFLGRRQADKVKDFPAKLRFPKSKKALQRYIGFLNYYRNFIPRLSEKTYSVFQTPQKNLQILCTNKLGRGLHKTHSTSGKLLSTRVETTIKRQTTYCHVRCKLHSSWIWYHD